ncbi:MAG: carbohydrate binding family 9 domain-containing protein [Saprospiraceae bacterium]|nr:carbohydrate binding family 9 domain-containing protein [Saprospiraceae bacterium]
MFILSCKCILFSQQGNDQIFQYPLTYTTASIDIDGLPLEDAWKEATIADSFTLNAPVDQKPATLKTEVSLLCDDKNIYLLAICYDDANYIIQTLKRDGFGDSDEFAFLIDPVGKKANGFGFGINAMGAQTEVILSPEDTDASWDNRWYSAVSRHPDKWIVEMKIPLKTLRFQKNNKFWRMNFARFDPGTNETSVWAPVPRQFDLEDIGYYGALIWPEAPTPQGGNLALIPYVSLRNEEFGGTNENKLQSGGDVKIGITPSLNLDLTTNPDFSQVEVDAQVTNLTRFNLFFPERRQFFIENNDIFLNFGQGDDQAFYSRRIGLAPNGSAQPILYGARLTGNVNEKLRIGIFNMQTQVKNNNPGNNFSGIAIQQRVFSRSRIRGLFLNRQSWFNGEWQKNEYSRNGGGDLQYTSIDGKWEMTGGYLHSFKPLVDQTKNGQLYGGIAYNGQNFRGFIEAQKVGQNYYSDMGFNSRIINYNPLTNEVFRIGYTSVSSMLDYYYYPKESKNVNFHWTGLENFVWVNDDATGLNEWYTRLRHFIFFKNTSALRFRLNNNFVRLIAPFDITTPFLPTGTYNMTEFNVQYNSDNRKKVQGELFLVYGQFFNGWKQTYRASLNFRVQPWGNFKIGVEHNDLRFPAPYARTKITLGTIRTEINFSTKVFWTTFFQYNTQADNFNINSRLQYRYAPMSDVFLVLTDNYGVLEDFNHKSRYLVLKVNYWLSL